MELFATLNVQRLEDKKAIERVMASRDKRWLASIGIKGSRAAQLSSGDDEDAEAAEQVDPDAEMAALDEEMIGLAMKTPADNERPVQLTMQLIRESLEASKKQKRRPRTPREEEKEIAALLKKKVLRLDWLDVSKIENLDAFTHVEELYLQYNVIEDIEGLDDHDKLSFLALAGNRIREVKNLQHLSNLKFLDLSMNYIEDFEISEFPKSLHILRLAGNPFVKHMPAYAHLFFERLPNLVQVDQFRRTTSPSDGLEKPPSSATSSVDSTSSTLDSTASVLPLPAMDAYRALQMEVELPHQEQEDDDDSKSTFSLSEYEKQRSDRMAKWKLQLTTLTSRTREQLSASRESIRAGSTTRFRARRSEALTRARQATDTALEDAANRFKQMELAHQDWQQSHQVPVATAQAS